MRRSESPYEKARVDRVSAIARMRTPSGGGAAFTAASITAAVGDAGGNLLLFAEDIGRHNTLDRIAGEALLKGIDLAGTMIVTSGRISTEMASKAARLDIVLIASRTSPTDIAVRMCDEAGITLLGYVHGGCKFTVYSHPERLGFFPK